MAQSSNALREPTTDEILTSIREIIEENTGRANRQPVERGANVNNRNMTDLKASVADNSDGQQSSSQSPAVAKPLKSQTLTVDDAMKALAARIGLNAESSSDNIENRAEQNAYGDEPSKLHDGSNQNRTEPENTAIRQDQDNNISARVTGDRSSDQNMNYDRTNENVVDVKDIDLEFFGKIDALAEAALRPIITNWLRKRWPALVDKILREEITNAFNHHFPSNHP